MVGLSLEQAIAELRSCQGFYKTDPATDLWLAPSLCVLWRLRPDRNWSEPEPGPRSTEIWRRRVAWIANKHRGRSAENFLESSAIVLQH
jgi:hypothetical protein